MGRRNLACLRIFETTLLSPSPGRAIAATPKQQPATGTAGRRRQQLSLFFMQHASALRRSVRIIASMGGNKKAKVALRHPPPFHIMPQWTATHRLRRAFSHHTCEGADFLRAFCGFLVAGPFPSALLRFLAAVSSLPLPERIYCSTFYTFSLLIVTTTLQYIFQLFQPKGSARAAQNPVLVDPDTTASGQVNARSNNKRKNTEKRTPSV